MKTRLFIGIDPGLSGGIAMLGGNETVVRPMPVMNHPKGRGRCVDANALRGVITQAVARHPQSPLVVIERQQPMPKQGVTSTFSIGESFGLLIGICVGLELPFEIVPARVWQKVVFNGIASKNTKAASIRKCGELYPTVCLLPTPRCKKPSDGMADALMIATFAQRCL